MFRTKVKETSAAPTRGETVDSSGSGVQKSLSALYLQGLFVGASNPKALLFFSAFFPQFLNPALPQMPQFLILVASPTPLKSVSDVRDRIPTSAAQLISMLEEEMQSQKNASVAVDYFRIGSTPQ